MIALIATLFRVWEGMDAMASRNSTGRSSQLSKLWQLPLLLLSLGLFGFAAYVFIDPLIQPKNGGIPTITGSSFAAPVVTGRIAAFYSRLTNKTDKHSIIPEMNTMFNGRILLSKDTLLADSIVRGYLAP